MGVSPSIDVMEWVVAGACGEKRELDKWNAFGDDVVEGEILIPERDAVEGAGCPRRM